MLDAPKPADVAHPVHDIVRERWSPLAFADRSVEPAVLASLFEAARWAPSSYNEQPWSFLVARREESEAHERLAACLVEGNRRWAATAPVLALSVASERFRRNDKPNRHALHDVGMAVMSLTFEATGRGLVVHQMAGFDADAARESHGIPEGFAPVAALAIGYPGQAELLPEDMRERERSPRQRREQSEFVFTGTWGNAR